MAGPKKPKSGLAKAGAATALAVGAAELGGKVITDRLAVRGVTTVMAGSSSTKDKVKAAKEQVKRVREAKRNVRRQNRPIKTLKALKRRKKIRATSRQRFDLRGGRGAGGIGIGGRGGSRKLKL